MGSHTLGKSLTTDPLWFGRDKQRQNKRSDKQEKARAKEIGGKVQAGSGSSWRARGDCKNETVLEELKYTDASSFSLKAKDWLLHKDRALKQGREPVMVIEFMQDNVRLVLREE